MNDVESLETGMGDFEDHSELAERFRKKYEENIRAAISVNDSLGCPIPLIRALDKPISENNDIADIRSIIIESVAYDLARRAKDGMLDADTVIQLLCLLYEAKISMWRYLDQVDRIPANNKNNFLEMECEK